MSAVVDNGSNSRFFRRPWAGREGLWPGLDTLVSYSCEKSSRSGSEACGQNHGLVRVEHERMEAGGRRVQMKRVGHCVWCLQPQRESQVMWKWGVCSYEEVWRHLNVSNPCAALRNCVKPHLAAEVFFWERSAWLVRFLFLYHLQHKLKTSYHYWLNSSTKTLLHLSEKLLQLSMDNMWMGTLFKDMWLKKGTSQRRENRGSTGVYNAQFSCLISEEEHLGFIL